MLDKVVVNDFQSVEKAELELGQITTIVGPSSSGKSAMLRALYLLFRNMSSVPVRAQSKSSKTTVSAQVDDKNIFVERGKSLSTYKINDLAYAKAGVTVPDKVKEVLNLYSASPDLHFAFQFDKPYLLDETGSTVSTTLGTLTQASTLRGAAKEGNRRALEAKRLLTTRQSDVADLKERLETEFSDVDQMQERLDKAERLYDDAVRLSKSLEETARVLTQAQQAKAATEALESVPVKDASTQIEQSDVLLSDLRELELSVEMLKSAHASVRDVPQTRNARAEIESIERNISLLENIRQVVDSAQQAVVAFGQSKTQYEKALSDLTTATDAVESLEATLPRCEACGQILPTDGEHGNH